MEKLAFELGCENWIDFDYVEEKEYIKVTSNSMKKL